MKHAGQIRLGIVFCSILGIHLSLPLVRECDAADAVFSRDGERIYAIADGEKKSALREINLKDQTTRTVSLTQLADRDWLRGIARSDDERIYCATEKKLWTFDPKSSRLTKVIDAPKGGAFSDVAYDSKTNELYVTLDGSAGPLSLLKNGRELASIWVRRHPHISGPVFTANGELFYSSSGDLWTGQIVMPTEEGERSHLEAMRSAPLATLETSLGTPSQMGVRNIAVARDAIYVQLFRMGGSGWGLMLQLPRPAKTENQLGSYKEMLQGLKELGENNRPANLCVSPDESRVYYVNEDKHFLIVDQKNQELTLKEQ